MEWFKMSSKLPRDPRWKLLSPKAKVAYVEWACEIAEQETDGIYACVGKAPAYVAELIAAGLAEPNSGGYFLPAYLKWNPTKADMDAKRIAGRNAARTRWSNAEPNTEVEVEVDPKNKPPAQLRSAGFETFWTEYPRKLSKGAAEKAYRIALKAVDEGSILAGLQGAKRGAWANRPLDKVPYAATWLRAKGWLDEPDVAPSITPDFHVAEEPSPEEVGGFAAAALAKPWSSRIATERGEGTG